MIHLQKYEILEIHERAIREFGGEPGVRDEGALESAIVSAENREWYQDADVIACAATYAYHLTMAHAFVDGNKRVAAATMRAFLIVNDVQIEAAEDALYDLFMGIAAGGISREAIDAWLRARVASHD